VSGFGFSALGSISLSVLPVTQGVALLMCLSLLIQITSHVSLRHQQTSRTDSQRHWFELAPYLIGGAIGLPVGLALLLYCDPAILLSALGIFLMVFAFNSLYQAHHMLQQGYVTGPLQALCLGLVGGVIGGFSAFPSSPIVVWNSLRGISKEASRALITPYIIFMQSIALTLLCIASPSVFTNADFWLIFLVAAPLVLIANHVGLGVYTSTGDRVYRQITLTALGLTGISLVIKVLST
jgi:uncharacterized membrane protein YfcA